MNVTQFLEAADDEGLEEDQRHLLRKPALIELEFRPDDNDRAARVIDSLAEQVLAEAPAFALEHVAEGFQGAVASASDGPAMAAIVEEGIDSLLQHPFFVADDDFRSLELEEIL